MKTIREESTAVEIYNEGLVVFLYDEANSTTIIETNPALLESFGGETDEALAELVKNGLLVAYELEQDDELAIEISIGPPLGPEELGQGRWHTPQRAPISIPSGKLCVEGYNNLRLSPDYDPSEDPGAVLDIPAGEYVLSLYRIDWEALAEAGFGGDIEEWGGPWQVIVFTEASEAETAGSPAPMLRFSTED